MQCKFCREEIPEGADVCPVCGTPVTPEENPVPEENFNQGTNFTSEENDGGSQEQQKAPEQQYQYSAGEQGANGNNNYGGYNYQPNNNQANYGNYGQSNNNQQGYGQPNYNQPNYNQPNYGQGGKPISSTPYMIFSIIATLFCCLPLGIAGIVFASKINSLQRMGDYEGAKAAAKKAKLFTILSAVLGLIVIIIYIFIGVQAMNEGNLNSDVIVESVIEDEDDVEMSETPKKPAEPSKDLENAWNSYTVQINDDVIKLPCKISDIEALGLTLDKEETPEDYIVNPGEYEFAFFEAENGQYIMVDMVNQTDKAAKIVDCTVGGIHVDSWAVEDGSVNVIMPGGVQIGTTKDDMLAVYGEPSNMYKGDTVHSYTWYDGDSYFKNLSIDIDADTGLVSGMTIQAYEL